MKEAKRLWSWLAVPCIALAVLTGSILPVLLGGGIPLFQGGFSTIPLALAETTAENGIVELTYLRRGNAPQTKPME